MNVDPAEARDGTRDVLSEIERLMSELRTPGRSNPPLGGEWTVAVPVVLGDGVAVADDAPTTTAVRLLGMDESGAGLALLAVGDRLRLVGGTHGHMVWPPATLIVEVLSGPQIGSRVQFIDDPDPRPAGDLAVMASRVLVGIDEPVLSDPARLAKLRTQVTDALQRARRSSP